jgi:hypothetical protein
MTQDGTTGLLSGMLSKSESCHTKPASQLLELGFASSISCSAQLSVSQPARPQRWEVGISDSLPLDSHEGTSAQACEDADLGNATELSDALVSPCPRLATNDSLEQKSAVPKLNLCLVGLSPLVPEELPHSANRIQDDLIDAQLQPADMSSSTMPSCTDMFTEVSEQFACGPIFSSYISSHSLCDGHPLAPPPTNRSVSSSSIASFQNAAADGKVSSVPGFRMSR